MLALWAVSHFLRAIGLTLAFHRYFAHRAFQMNRGARFVWAFIGTAAMQKGPLWWAGHHVNHHRFADRDGDPHSPTVSGFYYAHIGWFLNDAKHDRSSRPIRSSATSRKRRRSRLLERFYFVPPLLLAAGDVSRRRPAVAGLGLLPADGDAGARDVRDQHGQPPVRIAPLRHDRRVAQQRADGVLRGRARAGTTTTTAISARRATGSTGGSSIRRGTSSA